MHQEAHCKAPDPVPNALGHFPLNMEELNLSSPKMVKEKAGFQT